MSGPTELDETPAEEFSRLIIEFNEGERQNRNEAWNLIADFACEHSDAIIRALSQPQAGEPTGYIDRHRQKFASIEKHAPATLIEGGWTPVYLASPQPANPAQVTNAIRGIVEDALNSAIPEPWEVAEHATQRILAALQSQPIAPAGEGLVTEAMVEAAEAAVYPRHERGFLLKPLIGAIDMRAALTAALSKQEPVVGGADLPYPPIVISTDDNGQEHRVGAHEWRSSERPNGGAVTVSIYVGDHTWIEALLDPQSAKTLANLILTRPCVAALGKECGWREPDLHHPYEDWRKAISFAIETDEPQAFLKCWNHGEWDVLDKEWPEWKALFTAAPLPTNGGE